MMSRWLPLSGPRQQLTSGPGRSSSNAINLLRTDVRVASYPPASGVAHGSHTCSAMGILTQTDWQQ